MSVRVERVFRLPDEALRPVIRDGDTCAAECGSEVGEIIGNGYAAKSSGISEKSFSSSKKLTNLKSGSLLAAVSFLIRWTAGAFMVLSTVGLWSCNENDILRLALDHVIV